VANLIRFTLARNALLSGSPDQADRDGRIKELTAITKDEIQNAKRLFVLTRNDPRIGFEASNQYYYTPLDLVENVVNCEYVLHDWLPTQAAPR